MYPDILHTYDDKLRSSQITWGDNGSNISVIDRSYEWWRLERIIVGFDQQRTCDCNRFTDVKTLIC